VVVRYTDDAGEWFVRMGIYWLRVYGTYKNGAVIESSYKYLCLRIIMVVYNWLA